MMWHERPTSWPAPSGVIVIVLVALVGALADEDGRFIGSERWRIEEGALAKALEGLLGARRKKLMKCNEENGATVNTC